MGYLGIVFSDLPNRGGNLRLYTYDPPGTPYYTPSGWIYNTGHYDSSLSGGPCSMSDPQGFNDSAAMNSYASVRGEILVLVSRSDLAALCNYRPPVQTTIQPVTPTFTPPTVIAPGSSQGSTIQITGAASLQQPSTPGPIVVTSPSAPLDTGLPQISEPPSTDPDNTLLYAGLGIVALILLSGRRAA